MTVDGQFFIRSRVVMENMDQPHPAMPQKFQGDVYEIILKQFDTVPPVNQKPRNRACTVWIF